MTDLPEISDEMTRAFNRAFNEAYDRLGDDDPNQATRAGLAAALVASGWRPPTPQCAATFTSFFADGVQVGECDPHACTDSADHPGLWHTCRCGVMFKLATAQPKRIQRKRTKGWRMPENAVYVGRPTKWGNPWSVGDGYVAYVEPACDPARNNGRVVGPERLVVSAFVESAEQAVALYEGASLTEDLREEARAELAGKDLACWCALDQPCHADVLLEIANGPIQESE